MQRDHFHRSLSGLNLDNLNIRNSSFSAQDSTKNGFALVLSLALMSLVFLIVLCLLNLISTDLALSNLRKEKTLSRVHTLYAARIALGNLQEELGPDKRISATSDILDKDPSTLSIDGVVRKKWVGVWNSYQWDKQSSPSFEDARQNYFRKWLVSLNEDTSFSENNNSAKLEKVMYESTEDQLLVSATDKYNEIRVPKLAFNGNRMKDFEFAWWVGDEGVKARADIFPPDKSFREIHELQASMLATPRVSLESLDGLESYPPNQEDIPKVIDLHSLDRAMSRLNDTNSDLIQSNYFHDITTHSNSLFTDARKGGLKKDLNLLFELDSTQPGYGKDDQSYLYENKSTDLSGLRQKVRTQRSRGNKTEPRWEDLRGFYRQYKDTIVTNGDDGISFGVNGSFASNTQRLPVVAKLQIVFSYWARNIHGPWKGKYRKNKFLIHCVVEPVITLWNPFGLPLSFKEFRVNIRQIPVSLRWFKNGNQVGPGWRHYSEMWHVSRNRRKGFDIRIKPPSGQNQITLQPGEVITYSDGQVSLQEFIRVHGPHDDWHGRLSARLNYKSGWHILGGYYTDWLAQGRDVIPGNHNDLIGVQVKGQRSRHAGGMGDLYVDLHCTDLNGASKFIGGHRIQFRSDESKWLPELKPGFDTPERSFAEVHNYKQPFMLLNIVLKTEGDSKYPSLFWIHNSPINQLFHAYDLDEEHMVNMQYEMEMLPMSSFDDIPTIEIAYDNKHGYFGPGLYADKGLNYVTHAELPSIAPVSMASLRHANVAKSHNQPLVSYVVGNSYAHPLLPVEKTWIETNHRGQRHGDSGDKWGPDYLIDHSFHANDRLWDEFFFSSISPQNNHFYSTQRKIEEVYEDFQSGQPLPNSRISFWKPHSEKLSLSFSKLFGNSNHPSRIQENAFRRSASNLLAKGSLNVNSTSANAWAAMLGANNGTDVPIIKPGEKPSVIRNVPYPVSRFSMPNAGFSDDQSGFLSDQSLWSGFRSLDRYKIRNLAEKIVEQIKRRGPFLSLGEFVNRRVSNDSFGQRGAIQSALDDLDLAINEPFEATSTPIFKSDLVDYKYKNPDGAEGLSGEGAPGFITQADILAPISSSIGVRSDTFRIRAFSNSPLSGISDNQREGGYCELIVQRLPIYIDPETNLPEDMTDTLSLENKSFGRKFKVVRFRWLRKNQL